MRSLSIAGRNIQPFILCNLELLSGFVYIWSGIGDFEWNGNTYKGVGTFGSVSPITLTAQTPDQAQANNFTVTLSGIPSDLLSGALDEVRQNKRCAVYLGMWDMDSNSIASGPLLCGLGNTDVPTPTDGAETCSISITIETPLVGLGRASNRRYTMEDQKRDFPADTGLRYVSSIQQWSGKWGS